MLIPFKKKTWVALKEGNNILCLSVSTRAGGLELGEVVFCDETDRLPARDFTLVIPSDRILLSQESFVPSSEEAFKLQVDERLRPIGPWSEDTKVLHLVHPLSGNDQLKEYVILSIPEKNILQAIEALSNRGCRVRACFTHVAAIAGLVNQLTSGPIMACFLSRDILEIIACKDGIPFYSQISPIDDPSLLDFDIIGQAVYNVRQIIDSKLKKIDTRILFFSRYDLKLPEYIGQYQLWRPDLKGVLKAGSPDTFWKYPDLVGAPFAHKDFECLPKDFRFNYLIKDINKAAAWFSVAGCLFMVFSGNYLLEVRSKERQNYASIYRQVKKEKEKIVAVLPDPDRTQEISRALSIWKEVQEQPKLEMVLLELSRLIPAQVKISSLEATRLDDEKKGNNRPSRRNRRLQGGRLVSGVSKEKDMEEVYKKPLIVKLGLSTRGSFIQVKTRFERTISALSSKFKLSNVNWHFMEDSNKGSLRCRMDLGMKGGG